MKTTLEVEYDGVVWIVHHEGSSIFGYGDTLHGAMNDFIDSLNEFRTLLDGRRIGPALLANLQVMERTFFPRRGGS